MRRRPIDAPIDALTCDHRLHVVADELTRAREGVHGDAAFVLASPRSGMSAALAAVDGPTVPWDWGCGEVIVTTPILGSRPQILRDLVVRSQRGGSTLMLSSAISVPFAAAREHGWIVLGTKAPTLGPVSTESDRNLDRVAEAYELTRIQQRERLYRQVSEATAHFYRAVGRHPESDATMRAIVAMARDLVGTDSAYLSMPRPSDDYMYDMCAFENVRTVEFRNLTIRFGEGQGGLARATGRPVLVADYCTDPRLHNPPRDIVKREGFRSAIATPLFADGTPIACLYVANRSSHLLSEDDADRLALFGQHVAPILDSVLLEEDLVRLEVERTREHLTFELHETVMRALVEIALQADALGTRNHQNDDLGVIAQTARDALESLRLALIKGHESPSPQRTVSEVAKEIQANVSGGQLRTELSVEESERLLDAEVADCVVAVMREAVRNAELHSGGTRVVISLSDSEHELRLNVDDDGCGFDTLDFEPSGHFGVKSMFKRVDAVGGRMTLSTSATGGARVSATVPV